MSNFLFDEFEPTPSKAWKQKIQFDLDGLDYNKTLLWHSLEGVSVKPFYTKEDRSDLNLKLPKESFSICQSIFIDDENIANKLAVDACQKGADAIEFSANNPFNFQKVLDTIDLKKTKIYFNLGFLNDNFCWQLSKFINTSKPCFYNIDIIGNLAQTGNWFTNLKSDHTILEKITLKVDHSIAVNASIYQNAGANCIQQVGYALAHANEYLNHFGHKMAHKIHFNFAVGGNYFFEIAKLRAFRILWEALLNEYNTQSDAHIFVRPTIRNKTLYDYNVNMLRTTTECMSAIFGGANTISNLPYDAIFNKSNAFGERIAKNQLLILKEESGLENPQFYANGSYYIESITEQFAEKALEIFKQIEKAGGFLKQLKTGVIQKKISEAAQKEQDLFDLEELVLIGTNSHQNSTNTMKNNFTLYPFVKKRVEKTLIQPIIARRLAERIEQKRLADE